MNTLFNRGTKLTSVHSSTTILIELSKPSNDPEKVALAEQKLAKGEDMTVAQVKEVLRKLPETQREVIAQANYEIACFTRRKRHNNLDRPYWIIICKST